VTTTHQHRPAHCHLDQRVDRNPDSQQQLIDLLDEATNQVIRHRPGFISANIHASLDGTRVVNHAQWRSPRTSRTCSPTPPPANT
jgi:Antibiotic biosynthesis monooxygenase